MGYRERLLGSPKSQRLLRLICHRSNESDLRTKSSTAFRMNLIWTIKVGPGNNDTL